MFHVKHKMLSHITLPYTEYQKQKQKQRNVTNVERRKLWQYYQKKIL